MNVVEQINTWVGTPQILKKKNNGLEIQHETTEVFFSLTQVSI